jgi:hypothetical protein
MLAELQEARGEIDRLRKLVLDKTGIEIRGVTYWPEWVTEGLGQGSHEEGDK